HWVPWRRDNGAPTGLLTALRWINELFIGNPQDVRSWLLLDPLSSHAQSVAAFADARAIPKPTSRLMNHVAVLLQTKAQHRAAEPLMRRALAIDEACFGKDHPEVAISLSNLATLLQAVNRL